MIETQAGSTKTQHSGLIDAELVAGPRLEPRLTPAAAYGPLLEHVADHGQHPVRRPIEQDAVRDRLVLEARSRVDQQVIHDLSYNLQQLWHWASRLQTAQRTLDDAQVQMYFRLLQRSRQFLIHTNAWSSNQGEIDCWNTMQQFYCDALALAHKLLRLERGLPDRDQGTRQFKPAPGTHSTRLLQSVVNAAEQGFPNLMHIRPFWSLLPIVSYQAMCGLLPWPTFRWRNFVKYFRLIYSAGGLRSYESEFLDIIEMVGKAELLGNAELFEPGTLRTRHNIILAMSHRHSVMDCPLMGEALRGFESAVWANELYFPRSARIDPRTVLVSPAKKKSLEQTLARSAKLVIEQRLPLVIFVDGGGPYLLYGQQMRIKRGIRLVLDHLHRAAQGTGRRTYIVPVSFDDTVTFIQGLDPRVKITFHAPFCSDDIDPPPQPPDAARLNYGDPLLNHLECYFLTQTGQVRHGLRTPQVVPAVRRVYEELQGDGSFRGRVRKRFNVSIYDLCTGRW